MKILLITLCVLLALLVLFIGWFLLVLRELSPALFGENEPALPHDYEPPEVSEETIQRARDAFNSIRLEAE